MTGKWEARMAEISEGQGDRTTFMQDVCENVNELITAIKRSTNTRTGYRVTLLSWGNVQSVVLLFENIVLVRLYTCDTGRNCSFVVYGKSLRGR